MQYAKYLRRSEDAHATCFEDLLPIICLLCSADPHGLNSTILYHFSGFFRFSFFVFHRQVWELSCPIMSFPCCLLFNHFITIHFHDSTTCTGGIHQFRHHHSRGLLLLHRNLVHRDKINHLFR